MKQSEPDRQTTKIFFTETNLYSGTLSCSIETVQDHLSSQKSWKLSSGENVEKTHKNSVIWTEMIMSRKTKMFEKRQKGFALAGIELGKSRLSTSDWFAMFKKTFLEIRHPNRPEKWVSGAEFHQLSHGGCQKILAFEFLHRVTIFLTFDTFELSFEPLGVVSRQNDLRPFL